MSNTEGVLLANLYEINFSIKIVLVVILYDTPPLLLPVHVC